MNEEIKFILNSESLSVKMDPAAVLLDFIRKEKHLTGTKEGCKEGDCGACTVLLGSLINGEVVYKSVNSCLFPLGNVKNKHVVTIEGLNSDVLTPAQSEFVKEGASQCGFCTPGFIVSLTCHLINSPKIDFENTINAIAGNICRCTGYTSIKRALKNVIKLTGELDQKNRIASLIEKNILPKYFSNTSQSLKKLESAKANGRNEKHVRFIGGGTDLFVQQPDELLESDVAFIMDRNLSFIKSEGGACTVGAAATFEMIKQSEIFQSHFPNLNRYMDLIASLPIRNSATIGGNIINASPIGDMTIFFLALNAAVTLVKGKKRRKLLLKKLYRGYKDLDKDNDEYLESIEFKMPQKSYFNFEKVSKRTFLDIASVNSAISVITNGNIVSEAHISAGGVSPIPLYLEKTSRHLTGKTITLSLIEEAIEVAQSEISPISDIRGSAEYKRLLLIQLIKAHFIEMFPELIKVEELI